MMRVKLGPYELILLWASCSIAQIMQMCLMPYPYPPINSCRQYFFPMCAEMCSELQLHFIPDTPANCSKEDFPCSMGKNEKHCLEQRNGHKHRPTAGVLLNTLTAS